MKTYRPRRGVAWSKVGDVGVIINPWRERMIGLSAAAYDWWERLISGASRPDEPGPGEKLLPFLRQMGVFEGENGHDDQADEPGLPPQVLWVEAFEPLAFTYSCASTPGQSYACDQAPSAGPKGKPKKQYL